MRISDWSSDVCSSDLVEQGHILRDQQILLTIRGEAHIAFGQRQHLRHAYGFFAQTLHVERHFFLALRDHPARIEDSGLDYGLQPFAQPFRRDGLGPRAYRSEEHTSELPSLMRHLYA